MTPKERIAELTQELASNPASRQFYQLGELLRREGELAEAVVVLRQGLAHHPRYVAAWVSLGRALLDLQKLAEAQAAFGEALALDPQNPVAWRLLGETLLGLGQRREALQAFEHALALVPGDEVLEEAVASLKAELAPLPMSPVRTPPREEEVPGPEPFAESLAPPPPAGGDLFPTEPLAEVLREKDAVFPVSLEPPPPPVGDFLVEAPFPSEEGLAPVEVSGQELAASAPQPLGEALPYAEPVPKPSLPGQAAVVMAQPPEAFEKPVLPTLADARAAVHRGDLAAAAELLRQRLAAEPENQEAADLLALVQDMMEPLPPEEPKLSPREKKIAALQRFLASVTLARERLRV